jgi:hypothetical protein
MKQTLFIMLCGIMLSCGCSQSQTTEPDLQKQVQAVPGQPISRDQAISIASKAHNMEYYRDGKIEVELKDNQYIVIFPVDKRSKPGTVYLGPDYAAKVWLDAKDGKVLKVMVGS